MSSVALPKRDSTVNGESVLPAKKPPVWPVDRIGSSAGPSVSLPLASKCGRHQNGRRGVCCKELRRDERSLIDPDVMRDVVIGLSDGLTVPFALTAGLASLGSSKVVVLGGVAELIAGAISMGIGAFLATQAERDSYRFLEAQTSARVAQSCAGEVEREVHEILGSIGVPVELSRQVANALHKEEVRYRESGMNDAGSTTAVSSGMEQGGHGDSLKFASTIGITPFLLRFGQGLEPVPKFRMYSSAATIGLGYLVGGAIPLLPYFFIPVVKHALFASCVLTFIVLLFFGILKAHITGAGTGWKGYTWGAVSTVMVGGAAAAAAFGIVRALEGIE